MPPGHDPMAYMSWTVFPDAGSSDSDEVPGMNITDSGNQDDPVNVKRLKAL